MTQQEELLMLRALVEKQKKEIEEYIINEEDTCSKCGSPLKVIGKEVVRTEVEFKPARLIVKQIVRQIAKCTRCGTDDSDNLSQHFEKAAIPANVLSHSIATPSLVGHILHQKYVMGIPLNRMNCTGWGLQHPGPSCHTGSSDAVRNGSPRSTTVCTKYSCHVRYCIWTKPGSR